MDSPTQSILPFIAPEMSFHEMKKCSATSALVAGICHILGAQYSTTSKVPFQDPLILEAQIGSSIIHIGIERSFADEIMKKHLGLPGDYGLSGEMQAVVLETALSDALVHFESQCDLYTRLRNVTYPAQIEPVNFETYWVAHPEYQIEKVAIALGDDWLPIDLPLRPINNMLPIHLPISIGQLTLSADGLQNLALGDIMLCSALRDDFGLRCHLTIGQQQVAGRIENNQLTILKLRHHMNDNADIAEPDLEESFPNSEESGDIASSSLDAEEGVDTASADCAEVPSQPLIELNDMVDIPMTVRFDLGQLSLSLQEVQALCEGTVLELPSDVEELVHINVNGLYVGQGELVTIGDKAGVRILRLNQ